MGYREWLRAQLQLQPQPEYDAPGAAPSVALAPELPTPEFSEPEPFYQPPAPVGSFGIGDPIPVDQIESDGGGLPFPDEPVMMDPRVLAPPPRTFRDNLALSLSKFQMPQVPGMGGGQSFVSGLMSGLAGSMSSVGMADRAQREKQVEATNAMDKTHADRVNEMRKEKWKAELSDYYATKRDERGMVAVSPEDAKLLGIPAGSKLKPSELASRITDAKRFANEWGDIPVPKGDIEFLKERNAIDAWILNEWAQKGGKVSRRTAEALQKTIDNEREDARVERQVTASTSRMSQEQQDDYVRNILNGIAQGFLEPNPTKYGTNRDGLKAKIAAGAVSMGLDLARLQQDWFAKQRNLAAVNGPQQLRLRQAIEGVYGLIEELVGMKDERGNYTGYLDSERTKPALVYQLNNSGLPIANWFSNQAKRGLGQSSALRKFKMATVKLAGEQATVISGGNKPAETVQEELLGQFTESMTEEELMAVIAEAERTVRQYEEALEGVGPITPTLPFSVDSSTPVGGRDYRAGTQPAAGTVRPPRRGYYRVFRRTDGKAFDMPEGRPVPAGYHR